MTVPLLKPNYLPKAPPPDSPSRVRASAHEFGSGGQFSSFSFLSSYHDPRQSFPLPRYCPHAECSLSPSSSCTNVTLQSTFPSAPSFTFKTQTWHQQTKPISGPVLPHPQCSHQNQGVFCNPLVLLEVLSLPHTPGSGTPAFPSTRNLQY